MTARERVIKALNHEQPDKVPVDLGGTVVTGISAKALVKLRQALKLEPRLVKVFEPFLFLGEVEEDVRQTIGADIVGLSLPNTFFGYKNTGWKPWKLQDGSEYLVGEAFTYKVDPNGDTYAYPQGDTNVPPSAVMPKGGYYFDNIVRQGPLDEDTMNGRADFAGDFSLLSDEDLKYYENRINDLYYNTEYAIIGNFSGFGIGDAALLPGPWLKHTPGIRNIEDWYVAHLLQPDYIKEIFDYQFEIAMQNVKRYREVVGNKIQCLFVSGTDFGTQRGEFIAPDLFREIYKPYFKRINDWIHQNTSWKTFYHTCGSVVNLLDDFVEIGVDIINPVQCSAYGMEPEFLKKKYGDKLVFWGAAIDTQKTLPTGTPDQVRAETLERLRIFSEDGGFICNPIHNIQADTPAENMVAFFDAIREFNSL
jgi:hypothetical protein